VEWETVLEIGVSGFQVERALDGKTFVALGTFVPSRFGGVYSVRDTTLTRGVRASYRLIEIATNGTRTTYGPVTASLSQLGRIFLPFVMRESAGGQRPAQLPTATRTYTPTTTMTPTPTPTKIQTATAISTATLSRIPTATILPTATRTWTPTLKPTAAPTVVSAPTRTLAPPPLPTQARTIAVNPVQTLTQTPTLTIAPITATKTLTPTLIIKP